MKQTLSIANMSCQNCVKHVTNHLLELEGVNSVTVSLERKQAEIETQVAHDLASYQQALADTVYQATALN